MKQNRSKLWVTIILIMLAMPLFSQTPGLIYKPATGAGALVLDPNQDGYVSVNAYGFISDDVAESELPYVAVPVISLEPNADPGPGPNHAFNDIVDNPDEPNNAVFVGLDASNNLLVRFRLGGSSPNSKSYNLLIDTDGKFGFDGPNADPNAVDGNPGFEIEIDLATNFGVGLYDIDGLINPVTVIDPADDIASGGLPYDQYAQKSVALTTEHGDIDVFYDFFIPFSKITAAFPDVTPSTPLRFLFATSMNPHPVIGNSAASDLGGIDDDKYAYNYDGMFDLLVGKLDPISIDDLGNGLPVKQRTNCPYVGSAESTVITGTYDPELNYTTGLRKTYLAPTTIKVYKRVGAALTLLGTTAPADEAIGSWILDNTGNGTWEGVTLSLGDTIVASALADATAYSDSVQYGESYNNCNYGLIGAACSSPLFGISTNAKGVCGTGYIPGAIFKAYFNGVEIVQDANNLFTDLGPDAANPGYNLWVFSCNGTSSCSSGSPCLADGYYEMTQQQTGACESDPASACYGGVAASVTPTITTSPILTSTTTLNGTSGSGAIVEIFVDDEIVTSVTATGTSWTASPLTFTEGQSVYARAFETGLCASNLSLTSTVVSQTNTPTITGDYCTATTITEISGYVEEISGNVEIYVNGTGSGITGAISETGSWTVTGLGLNPADIITAFATDGSRPQSNVSNSIIIGTISANTAVVTGSYTEGDLVVSGSGTEGDVVTLYLDGYYAYTDASQSVIATDVVASGAWSITLHTDFPLYANAELSVSSTTGANCESDQSAIVEVACNAPTNTLTIIPTPSEICYNEMGSLTVENTEGFVVYTPWKGDLSTGSPIGFSVMSTTNGSDITLETQQLTGNETITVKMQKISSGTCESLNTNSASYTVNPELTAGISSSSDPTCLGGSDGEIIASVSGGSGTGYEYQLNGGDWQSSATFSNLPASTYNIIARDNTLCTDDYNNIVLNDGVGPCSINISINDISAAEGNSGTSNFDFTVGLDNAYGSNITVDYVIAHGAVNPTDNSDITTGSGTITILAGETSQTISVSVSGDTSIENDESFTVTISNPSFGNITDDIGEGIVQNDDVPAVNNNPTAVL
ncbi:Calx-beta domain-containing protein, partial [Labilibacter marinus]|uniref:Calx-beta domain-containing protein n=1 Tax=Labilibacter marinus TaxID=1477105 RepID=UPI00117AE3B0